VLLSACSSKSPQPASSGTASATASATPLTEQRINIKDFSFTPARLTIKAGTKIVWSQTSTTTIHTVTSGNPAVDPTTKVAQPVPDGKFASGDLKPGATFPFTFSTPGTYTYFCSHHPDKMQGTIIVQ
jgi:plastocyanin